LRRAAKRCARTNAATTTATTTTSTSGTDALESANIHRRLNHIAHVALLLKGCTLAIGKKGTAIHRGHRIDDLHGSIRTDRITISRKSESHGPIRCTGLKQAS
jgi:hypothetical protein